jgi:hypothetical protein
MTDRARPTSVTVLAVLALCLGLVFLLGATIGSVAVLGIGAAMGAESGVASPTAAMTLASFSVLSISSVLYLAFGLGSLVSYPSAWHLGIAGAAFALVSVVIALVGGIVGDYISVAISVGFAGVMLFSLLRAQTIRAYFGR